MKAAKKASRQKMVKNSTQDGAKDVVSLFRGFSVLYTLQDAAQKGGRKVRPEDLTPIRDAALVAKNGRVLWVGEEKKLPRQWSSSAGRSSAKLQEFNFKGRVGIPALVESHTHLIYSGNRADEFERRNQGEGYQSIARSGGGILSTVRKTRGSSEKDLVKIGQERADRFLRQGVTTIEVKSGYALTIEDEFKMLRAANRLKKARIVPTFLGAHAIAPEFGSAQAYLDYLREEALPRLWNEALANRIDIFVEDGYFPKDMARTYLKAAREQGFDIAVHADQLTRSGGAELAVEMKARSAEHLIRINESDIKRLARSEVTCVLLPSADLYMNCPYPPARELLKKGARVALATDFNPGSAPSQDVALVGVLARVMMKMSLAETLVAYTVGGAYALGLEDELGSLEKGKLCDFCVLDGDFEELFLEVGRMPVSQVYREGKRLV